MNLPRRDLLVLASATALIASITVILGNLRLSPSQVVQYNQTAETEPGKTELAGGLLSDFPNFPAYPGSVAKRSYRKEEGELVGYSVLWLIDDYDNVSEVMRWYTDMLTSQSWVILENPDESESLKELSIKAGLGDLVVYLTVEKEEKSPLEVNIEFPLQRTNVYSPLNPNL